MRAARYWYNCMRFCDRAILLHTAQMSVFCFHCFCWKGASLTSYLTGACMAAYALSKVQVAKLHASLQSIAAGNILTLLAVMCTCR